MENNYKEYMGYKVYEDGTVISPKGKELKKRPQISLQVGNGAYRVVNYLKFIYFVYHQDSFELFGKKSVESKDGTTNISSLYEFRTQGRGRKAKVSEELANQIKEEYFTKNRNIESSNRHKAISYRRLAQKYKLSVPTIQSIVNKTYKFR